MVIIIVMVVVEGVVALVVGVEMVMAMATTTIVQLMEAMVVAVAHNGYSSGLNIFKCLIHHNLISPYLTLIYMLD